MVGDERLKGFLIDVLEELQSRLNFTYDLYLVADGKYGYEDKEGIWHGLIGELISGRADMALAPLTMSRRRAHVIQVTGLSHRKLANTQIPIRSSAPLVGSKPWHFARDHRALFVP